MKHLLFACLALSASTLFAQQPTVTITGTDSISHSVARVIFNVSAPYSYAQTLITPVSLGSCASGSLPANAGKAAWIQPISPFTAYTTDMRIVVGGMQADTDYMLCPEVSTDNKTWSSGASVTIHTLPLPAVHPALPVPAQTFDTDYPDTTGFQTLNVNATNCNDPGTGLQAQINNALNAQASTGSLIVIPAGETCLGHYNFWVTPATAKAFNPNGVSTANNTITIPNHGFSEGQQVTPGRIYSSLPTIATPNPEDPCSLAGALIAGEDYYYVHVQDANTIQLYCSATQANGGALVQFKNQGSTYEGAAGNHLYLSPTPNPLKNIVIRTSTPDSQLPAGKRVTPDQAAKLAYLVKPAAADGGADNSLSYPVLSIGDGNMATPIANIRFVGIEITTQKSAEDGTTTDPRPWEALIYQEPTNENIVFDRCWLHGQDEPDRVNEINLWNGKNVAWIDSYWDNLNYYHAAYHGLAAAQTSATTYTIQPGTWTLGTPQNVGKLTSPVTITLSGAGTGPILNYFDMAGKFQIVLPTGVTGTCAGDSNCTVTTSATTLTGTGSCQYDDARFPRNSQGNIAAGPVACGQITNGQLTALANTPNNGTVSRYDTEGCGCTIAGQGPGPYMFVDNYVEGTGIPIHHDDGGDITYFRHDYTYLRNYFYTPFTHMWNGPQSDGMRYYSRQPLEWKGGWRIHIEGNIFDGNWAEDNPDGVFIAMTSRSEGTSTRQGWNIQDVDIVNNTFEHGPGLIYGPAYVDGGTHAEQPDVRFRFENNLAWDINGWLYNSYTFPTVPGTLFQGANGGEDRIIDHNTIVGNTGLIGAILEGDDTLVEGLQVTNNIFQLNGTGNCPSPAPKGGFSNCEVVNGGVVFISGPSAAAMPPPGCPVAYNGAGQATADCLFPGYRWHNNLMLAGLGTTAAQMTAWWPNTSTNANGNLIPSDSAIQDLGFVSAPASAFNSFANGVAGTNFRFAATSPYANAGVGANIDQLEAAEGITSTVQPAPPPPNPPAAPPITYKTYHVTNAAAFPGLPLPSNRALVYRNGILQFPGLNYSVVGGTFKMLSGSVSNGDVLVVVAIP